MANTTSTPTEHSLVTLARSMPLEFGGMSAESRLDALYIGETRSIAGQTGLVRQPAILREFRESVTAHRAAIQIIAERRAEAAKAETKALQIPPMPARGIGPCAPRQKVRLVMPGRPGSGPVLTEAQRATVLGDSVVA